MRHPVLFGEFDLTIDDKNRLLIPSEVRREIAPEQDGEAFFLIVGINRRPWLYPERYYRELIAQTPPEITPADDALAFDQLNFGMAYKLEWDKQWRILIPEKPLKRTGLSKEVTMVGARDHLELWNRPDWETRVEELLQFNAEIAKRAKEARAKRE